MPALALAQFDVSPRRDGQDAAVGGLRIRSERVVADLADHVDVQDADSETAVAEPALETVAETGSGEQTPEDANRVLCIAGRSPLDQAGCAILIQLLERRKVAARLADPEALAGGLFALNTSGVQGVCVFYLDHRSLAALRYSVRRLRKKFTNVPIALCLWGGANLSSMAEAARADATVGSLADAVEFCAGVVSAETKAEAPIAVAAT